MDAVSGSDSFSTFASLNRFFALAEKETPSAEVIESVIKELPKLYGVTTEEEILTSGNAILIETYLEAKSKILSSRDGVTSV